MKNKNIYSFDLMKEGTFNNALIRRLVERCDKNKSLEFKKFRKKLLFFDIIFKMKGTG